MATNFTDAHLLLIDGLNVVRRVYEASPAPDSPEKAAGAMRSSIASFRRALNEHSPTHAVAVFDYGGPTWRHELYPDYRCKRKPMPQPLAEAIPSLREELQGMGLATFALPGVEADDVLAALALRWEVPRRGPVTLLSTDKDLASLITQGVRVRDHFGGIWRDEQWVQEKFSVSASQLQDLLALAGDSSDDIPGVPGVGLKTAAKLLGTYGCLDGVLANAQHVSGKVGESLRASVELLGLSRRLVSFKTDMTLGLTWNALRFVPQSPAV